ncbi:MAG: archease, partial [Desulfomonilaceae bacterium]
LEADSLVILFADWLREILFYFNVEQFILRNLVVSIENTENLYSLKARLSGSIIRDLHVIDSGLEIKGVTYHDLSVNETPEGFVAYIIFDV